MSNSVSLEFLNSRQPITATSVSAVNTSGATLAVILAGVSVPLPTRTYINGFSYNGANTICTVANAGTYKIDYLINTTTALGITATVLINGTQNTPLTIGGLTTNRFASSSIATLAAGSTIELRLTGLVATAVLATGAGASINITRLA